MDRVDYNSTSPSAARWQAEKEKRRGRRMTDEGNGRARCPLCDRLIPVVVIQDHVENDCKHSLSSAASRPSSRSTAARGEGGLRGGSTGSMTRRVGTRKRLFEWPTPVSGSSCSPPPTAQTGLFLGGDFVVEKHGSLSGQFLIRDFISVQEENEIIRFLYEDKQAPLTTPIPTFCVFPNALS